MCRPVKVRKDSSRKLPAGTEVVVEEAAVEEPVVEEPVVEETVVELV